MGDIAIVQKVIEEIFLKIIGLDGGWMDKNHWVGDQNLLGKELQFLKRPPLPKHTHSCVPGISKRLLLLSLPKLRFNHCSWSKSPWWIPGCILPPKRILWFSMKFKAPVKDRNVHVRMSGMAVSGFLGDWEPCVDKRGIAVWSLGLPCDSIRRM